MSFLFQIFVFNSCACQAIAYQTIPQKCLMFTSEISMRQMLTTEKAHLFNTTYCYCVTVQWIHTCLKCCFDSLCQQRILMCLQIRFTVWRNSESGWGGTLSSPEYPVLWQPVFLRHVHRGSGWIQVWLHHITRNRPKGIIIINRLHLHIRNSGHWGKCTSK